MDRVRKMGVHGPCEKDGEVHGPCEKDGEVHGPCEKDGGVHGPCEKDNLRARFYQRFCDGTNQTSSRSK